MLCPRSLIIHGTCSAVEPLAAILRRYQMEVIQRAETQVNAADIGRLGLLASDRAFGLVIVDVQTNPVAPDTTGVQILALIRNAGIQTPFIVIAEASEVKALEKNTEEVDSAAVLSRPVDPSKVLHLAENLMFAQWDLLSKAITLDLEPAGILGASHADSHVPRTGHASSPKEVLPGPIAWVVGPRETSWQSI